jgi:predicted ester cyclase
LHDVFNAGDRAAVRWTMRGIHRATFAGIAATQREVVQDANVIYRFDDAGRIAQVWMRADTLGLYQQLGVIAPSLANPAPSVLLERLQ